MLKRLRAATFLKTPVPRAVVASVVLIIAVLLSFPVIESIVTKSESVALVVAIAVFEVLIGVVGAMLLLRRGELLMAPSTSIKWRSTAWLIALCIGWGALIVLARQAAYLGFVLYFLALWLLPPALGSVVAIGLAVLTGLGQSVHHSLTAGAFIGPIAAAAIFSAMMIAVRALIAQSAARAELIDALRTAQARLSESEREAGRLAERSRLGRELHDTVAQHLSSIQLLLHAAERVPGDEARAQHLHAAREAASSALTDTRAFIRDLTPAQLAGSSLTTAIQRVGAAASESGRLGVDVRIEGTPRNLPTTAEATLLRIAQEAISNVKRHANASQVEMTLNYGDDQVSLEISDDGQGFDSERFLEQTEAADVASFGIVGMRARAAELGGYVAVVGEPGSGTFVSAQLPIHASDVRGAP